MIWIVATMAFGLGVVVGVLGCYSEIARKEEAAEKKWKRYYEMEFNTRLETMRRYMNGGTKR